MGRTFSDQRSHDFTGKPAEPAPIVPRTDVDPDVHPCGSPKHDPERMNAVDASRPSAMRV